jgi:hypothetical protein
MFGGSAKLSRHIHPNQRFNKRRPSPDAFIDSKAGSHLSVLSMEIASKKEVREFCANHLQRGISRVAVCTHTVYEYNRAATETDAQVGYDRATKRWTFKEAARLEPAYQHRPTVNCQFHCGVEYIRVLNEIQMLKVARRLAKKDFEVL